MVPSPENPYVCVSCVPRDKEYYSYQDDVCSQKLNNDNYDCHYKDICRKCNTDIDKFCLRCVASKDKNDNSE